MIKIKISDPGLIQCERVNVLDVRPVNEKGLIPTESILSQLDQLDDESSLLVVSKRDLPVVEDRSFNLNYFVDRHYRPSGDLWNVFHKSHKTYKLTENIPADVFTLPLGMTGQAVVIDLRSYRQSEIWEWIRQKYKELTNQDYLVLHCSKSYVHDANILGGPCYFKEISSSHIRLEFKPV